MSATPLWSRRLRRSLVARLRAFPSAQGATAGLEFALIMPVIAGMLVGVVELSTAYNASKRVAILSNTLAEILAQDGTLSADGSYMQIASSDYGQLLDSIQIIFPQLVKDSGGAWLNQISAIFSLVNYTANPAGCTVGSAGCTVTAKLGWSIGSSFGAGAYRPCGMLTPAPDGSMPTPTTLPASTFSPGSTFVVDIVYTYRPMFAEVVTGPVTMRRSSYFLPRNQTNPNSGATVAMKLDPSAPTHVICP